ncbi:MAG: serine--tRNA ligase [Bacteroidales bacterium]|jgi:seryl-tRNA synthetase|nr:serine--tRNA ligase [Bacteroidales bacterium]
MLQLNIIKECRQQVIERLSVKNFPDAELRIDRIIALDAKRRELQKAFDDTKAVSNQLAKQIGVMIKEGKTAEADKIKMQTAEYKLKEKEYSDELTDVEMQLNASLLEIPNLPHSSVPTGKSSEDNEVVSQWGEVPKLDSDALCHWDICEKYDIVDFALGNKITGAGFPVYKGKGAKLQRSLISFFLDRATANGFLEVQPPLMVNEQSALATGQLPDKDGQMYFVSEDKLFLIPTAEVPVTNIFRDEILNEKDFPVKRCAYSQCFRREAGSYGKDVRGLNRLHQFDKVEIVVVEHPDRSYEQLEQMKAHVSGLLESLELPYRILRLCGGDMSFTSALTFDFEVFSAAQGRWLEVSSVSNFETFQSNRMKLRFKNSEGKNSLAHTLNGSALALPRIVAALLENNQTKEGIRIPKALQPYTGFDILY